MRSIAGSQTFQLPQRDQLTILTKVWWRYDMGREQTKAEPWCKRACTVALERFCHELGTDYVDIVLLHCLMSKEWVSELEPYMDALSEAKDQGKVKAVGVSCHHLDALEVSADCPWVDVILARINPKGAHMDGEPDRVVPVLRRARENGKAILGMKILGEGQLADQREHCIQYAQELGLLDAMTIGFEQPHQIDQIAELIHQYPAAPVV
jgi:1-deoxyxylulose-5-phosphate synthase